MDTPLAITALTSAASAGAWVYVGWRLARRRQLDRHRAAGRALSLAFLAAGGYVSTSSALAVLRFFHLPAERVALPAAWATIVLGVVMVGGLVAYLAHLLTGRPRAVLAVAVVYGIQLLVIVAVILALGPVGAYDTGWTLRFEFARADARANPLIAASLLAPAAVASLAYLSLLRTTSDATARWRIALVGGGFTLWLAAAIVGRVWLGSDGGLAAARAAALLAAVAVVLAYSPPALARRRWGVRALASEVERDRPGLAEREARRAALVARMRELI